MKSIIQLITLCFFLIASLNLMAQERTKKIDKKIKRTMEKIWGDKSIVETPMATDLSIELDLFFEENQLNLLTENGEKIGYMLLRRGYGCKIGGCGTGRYAEGASCSADGGTYETFDYIVFFNENLEVLKMNVVDYPGDYGYEICSKNWLKQFIGFRGEELIYKSDIDAISGATISASSITFDIQEVHKYMAKLISFHQEELLTGSASNN